MSPDPCRRGVARAEMRATSQEGGLLVVKDNGFRDAYYNTVVFYVIAADLCVDGNKNIYLLKKRTYDLRSPRRSHSQLTVVRLVLALRAFPFCIRHLSLNYKLCAQISI